MEYFGPSHSADLATLSKLDESVLLDELRQRYESDRIYVRFNPSLFVTIEFLFVSKIQVHCDCSLGFSLRF